MALLFLLFVRFALVGVVSGFQGILRLDCICYRFAIALLSICYRFDIHLLYLLSICPTTNNKFCHEFQPHFHHILTGILQNWNTARDDPSSHSMNSPSNLSIGNDVV